MDSVSLIFSCVLYSEIVPLAVRVGCVVVLQVALILIRTNFHGFSQITTLKSRLKLKCLIDWQTDERSISIRPLRWLFNFCLIYSEIWLQFLVIPIQSWTTSSVSVFVWHCVWSRFIYLPVLVRLLKVIWQISRIEVVSFLIRLIDGAVRLITGVW